MYAASLQEQFEYIILSDVVEHLAEQELLPIFGKAADLLTEAGELVIHTPNGNVDPFLPHPLPRRLLVHSFSLLRNVLARCSETDLRHAFYSQVHINVMTPDELAEMLTLTGFNDIRTHLRNDHPSPFRHLLAKFGFSSDFGLIARKRRRG